MNEIGNMKETDNTELELDVLKPLLTAPTLDKIRLREIINDISNRRGVQTAYNIIQRIQASLTDRKPTLGFYDHTGHIIGGGQKYGFTLVHALQDIFDVTIILNKEITHKNIEEWYHLDLSKSKIKVIPIPFFHQFDGIHLDPARVSRRMENPFHVISRESGNYDFFVNNSMNEMVYPLAPVSSLICHFPERRPKSYFYADQYTHVIYNSEYTAGWIERKWKFKPHKHIFPPVDMDPGLEDASAEQENNKENILLSVARFEAGGSKKQLEMVRTFLKLNLRYPDLLNKWELVLIGGSPEENDYLKGIKTLIKNSGATNIRLLINCSGSELKEMYKKAKIFWHLCGLDQTDPALVEHFGMTIVEAMQNHLAPIVFDGGGQREIVEEGVSGFRVTSTAQLLNRTMSLIRDSQLLKDTGNNAFQRSKLFSRERFEKTVQDFFLSEQKKYCSI